MAFTVDQVDLGYGRGWLRPDAAASCRRVDAALGHPWQVTEAGRTWGQQNDHWLIYQRDGWPIALHPDTPSIHQIGGANDTNERPVALLNDHGWYQTVYRWVNGVWTLVEEWHFEYFPERDNHRHEGNPADNGSTPLDPSNEEEEYDMTGFLITTETSHGDGGKHGIQRWFITYATATTPVTKRKISSEDEYLMKMGGIKQPFSGIQPLAFVESTLEVK